MVLFDKLSLSSGDYSL